MQDLNKYISGLLFIHDCVILPGFGGFVTNYHEAEHEELSNTFHPPKKDVLFNKNLTYNDGLIINYLAKNANISYREAEQIIKNEVQNAWLKLEDDGEVCFDGIGTFKYNKNCQLVFNPVITENLLTDSYGLSSFRFPPLNYQQNAHKLSSTYNSQTMNLGLKQTLKWAAIAIPIVGILALVPYIKNQNQQSANIGFSTPVQNETPIEDTHSAMIPDTNISGMINNATDKRTALFYSEENQTAIKKQTIDANNFHIIGASYKAEENALTHANNFITKGFNAEVIENNNLYRVSIAQFDSKVNALHELRRIRNEEQNDKVWLFAN